MRPCVPCCHWILNLFSLVAEKTKWPSSWCWRLSAPRGQRLSYGLFNDHLCPCRDTVIFFFFFEGRLPHAVPYLNESEVLEAWQPYVLLLLALEGLFGGFSRGAQLLLHLWPKNGPLLSQKVVFFHLEDCTIVGGTDAEWVRDKGTPALPSQSDQPNQPYWSMEWQISQPDHPWIPVISVTD